MSRLLLTTPEVLRFAKKYDKSKAGKSDEKVEIELIEWFKHHRFLDKDTFLKLCLWKSPRPSKHYQNEINSDERVKYITSLSIASRDEYFKVGVLQLLRGVSFPVASVILHFAHPDKYMILDFRAIWSLGWEQPKQYTYEFWQEYTNYVNLVVKSINVSLRTFDKALWQYSKENQKL